MSGRPAPVKPAIGSIVWYYPGVAEKPTIKALGQGPLAAIVVGVWNNRLVNLAVFDGEGEHHKRLQVELLQDGDDAPTADHYAAWAWMSPHGRRVNMETAAQQTAPP